MSSKSELECESLSFVQITQVSAVLQVLERRKRCYIPCDILGRGRYVIIAQGLRPAG